MYWIKINMFITVGLHFWFIIFYKLILVAFYQQGYFNNSIFWGCVLRVEHSSCVWLRIVASISESFLLASGGGHLHTGGFLNHLSATTRVVRIIPSFWIWRGVYCMLSKFRIVANISKHPSPFLNSSFGFAGRKHYQSIYYPYLWSFLPKCCFSMLLSLYFVSLRLVSLFRSGELVMF